MTDRELLEAAAKAAGLEYNGLFFDAQTGLLVWEPPTNYESRDWNPLADDGDALRLAVKLRLAIHHDDHEPGVTIWHEKQQDWIATEYGNDPCAATRRAIVRAAAEIGRSMT